MPGFIDPHLHPLLARSPSSDRLDYAEPWSVMGEKTPATLGQRPTGRRSRRRLPPAGRRADLHDLGYSADSHGDLSGDMLDSISKDVPILVLQRSMHEIYINTPMLAFLKTKGLDAEKFKDHPQIDWKKNHFWEDACSAWRCPTWPPSCSTLPPPDPGYRKTRDYLTYNGVTTVADMNTAARTTIWRCRHSSAILTS